MFATEGIDIAMVYLNEHDDARETKRRVEAAGRRCLAFAGDVGDETFWRRRPIRRQGGNASRHGERSPAWTWQRKRRGGYCPTTSTPCECCTGRRGRQCRRRRTARLRTESRASHVSLGRQRMTDMDIGLMMDGDYREGQTQREAFDSMLTTADLAETLGFDSIWLAERHFSPPGGAALISSIGSAPLLVATAIATRTSRLRIGTAVLLVTLGTSGTFGGRGRHARSSEPWSPRSRDRSEQLPPSL